MQTSRVELLRTSARSLAALVLVAACAEAPTPTAEPSHGASGAPIPAMSPTPPDVTVDASATPAPAPTNSSATDGPALDQLLAAPGTIVVASVDPGMTDDWSLTLRFVDEASSSVITRSVGFQVPDGWRPREKTPVSVATDGWAALELNSIEDRDIDDDAILVLDLLDGGTSGAILGSAPMWLPGGTLLFTMQLRIGRAFEEVARRIPDHGLGDPIDLVVDDGPPWPRFPGHYVVRGDGSGLQAVGSGGPPTWRGVHLALERQGRGPVDPLDPPLFVFGDERSTGARGEIVSGCPLGTCPERWYWPDGSSVSLPLESWTAAWTRDGRWWVAFDGSDLYRLRASGKRVASDKIGPVPPDGLEGDVISIVGMSDTAAVIEGDDAKVTVVPLDGSQPIGPLDGTLAAVVP